MPSKKQTAKGNKPAASIHGMNATTPPAISLVAEDVTETEFDVLTCAAENDGVRIMSQRDDELPTDAPENAYSFKAGERLLAAKNLLQYIRSEQWPGQVFYDVYRTTPEGDALWSEVRKLFEHQERTVTLLDRLVGLGELSETEHGWLEASMLSIQSIREKREGETPAPEPDEGLPDSGKPTDAPESEDTDDQDERELDDVDFITSNVFNALVQGYWLKPHHLYGTWENTGEIFETIREAVQEIFTRHAWSIHNDLEVMLKRAGKL